jgi:hypothetical protein
MMDVEWQGGEGLGIREGGRRGYLGSCIYIKFEGRGSGKESGGCCILVESVLIFTVCIDRA